jgi:hypothetical protein
MSREPSPRFSLLHLVTWQARYASLVGEDGRALLENKSPLAAALDVERRVTTCPYVGSRQASGKPMNVAALAPIARDFERILACTEQVRVAIFGAQAEPSSLGGLHQMALAFKAWPLFGQLAAREATVVVPRLVASAFKVHVGLLGGVRTLLRDVILTHGPGARLDADVLLEFLEHAQALVGGSEVCSAPPPMLARFVRAVCHGCDAQGLEGDSVPGDLIVFAAFFRRIEGLFALLDVRIGQALGYLSRHADGAAIVEDGARYLRSQQRYRVLLPLGDAHEVRQSLLAATAPLDGDDLEVELALDPLVERAVAAQTPEAAHPREVLQDYSEFEAEVLERLEMLRERWNECFPRWATEARLTPGDLDRVYGGTPRALAPAFAS